MRGATVDIRPGDLWWAGPELTTGSNFSLLVIEPAVDAPEGYETEKAWLCLISDPAAPDDPTQFGIPVDWRKSSIERLAEAYILEWLVLQSRIL